jgi:hypothetical protein
MKPGWGECFLARDKVAGCVLQERGPGSAVKQFDLTNQIICFILAME